jgi:pyruvate/2-oxoglutarate dehydrogenase complex dihydrolipoamide dehydrogenase (E3) component
MAQPEEFDFLFLRGGSGSTVAAWTFAGEGNRAAVVDRKYTGGSCPNVACLPARTSSTVRLRPTFAETRSLGSLTKVSRFMPGVRDRKRKMVSGLNDMSVGNYRKTGGEFILEPDAS